MMAANDKIIFYPKQKVGNWTQLSLSQLFKFKIRVLLIRVLKTMIILVCVDGSYLRTTTTSKISKMLDFLKILRFDQKLTQRCGYDIRAQSLQK